MPHLVPMVGRETSDVDSGDFLFALRRLPASFLGADSSLPMEFMLLARSTCDGAGFLQQLVQPVNMQQWQEKEDTYSFEL